MTPTIIASYEHMRTGHRVEARIIHYRWGEWGWAVQQDGMPCHPSQQGRAPNEEGARKAALDFLCRYHAMQRGNGTVLSEIAPTIACANCGALHIDDGTGICSDCWFGIGGDDAKAEREIAGPEGA